MTDDVLTSSAVGRRLGVSADRVRQLEREGRLVATMTPLGRLFERTEVEAFAQRRAERLSVRIAR